MNERFRADMNEGLRDIVWNDADTAAVMRAIRSEHARSPRRALRLALIAALIALMACAGYAEYRSALLSSLFRGERISRAAEELLTAPAVSVCAGGVTATITEGIFDGQTLHLAGKMTNNADEPLLCGMAVPGSAWSEGIFGEWTGRLIAPGESREGRVRIDIDALTEYGEEIPIYVMAARPAQTPEHDEAETDKLQSDEFAWEKILPGAEIAMEEELRVPLTAYVGRSLLATAPEKREYRMDGYTIAITKANFAATSTMISFEIIPDAPEDILACGDEGAEGHGQLYRNYRILCPDGNGGFAVLRASGGYGWQDEKTKLAYSYQYGPLTEPPAVFRLVPEDDAGELIETEAIEVRVVRQ